MLTTVFIFFPIFMTIIGVGISALLIYQDKEIRRQKAVIDEQKALYQNNTKELEKFYQEKKKLEKDKDDEIAKMESLLQDERDGSILAARSSEMLKSQLKQQQEELVKYKQQQDEFVKLKSEAQKLSEQLQKANEARLVEVQNEKQKWTETLQSKETTLQKLGSEASSMESVMDTLALISKEMHRRLDEHYSKMRLLDEKAQENLELMAQLEH